MICNLALAYLSKTEVEYEEIQVVPLEGKDYLDAIIEKFAARRDVRKRATDRYLEAQTSLVKQRGGFHLRFKLTTPFISGTGISGAYQTGFLFHPVLNSPYLPGSSVKGMIRNLATYRSSSLSDITDLPEHLKPTKFDQERHLNDFGWQKDDDGHGGRLVFHDAIFDGDVSLAVDVRTPHKEGETPNPLFFLTVEPGCFLNFFISPGEAYLRQLRKENGEVGEAFETAEKAKLKSWFRPALQLYGAGAMTKGWRGRMACDPLNDPSIPECCGSPDADHRV